MNTVYCPVIDGQIDGTTCLEIVQVADGELNKRLLDDIPEVTEWNEEQRQKCLHCKWHNDIESGDD